MALCRPVLTFLRQADSSIIRQTELAQRMGLSLVNLSILKNNRARAIRFSTLTALCDALGCQPGDLFSVGEPARPN